MPYANHKTKLCMGKKNDANSPLPCKIPCHFPPFPLWVLKALGCFLLHLRKNFLENLWSSWRSKNGSCNFFLTPFPTTTLWIFQKCHHLLPRSILKLWLKIHVWPFLKAKNNAKKKQNTAFHWKVNPRLSLPGNQSSSLSVWSNLTAGYPKNSHIFQEIPFTNQHFWYLCSFFGVCFSLSPLNFFSKMSECLVHGPSVQACGKAEGGAMPGSSFRLDLLVFVDPSYIPPQCDNGSQKKCWVVTIVTTSENCWAGFFVWE